MFLPILGTVRHWCALRALYGIEPTSGDAAQELKLARWIDFRVADFYALFYCSLWVIVADERNGFRQHEISAGGADPWSRSCVPYGLKHRGRHVG